MKNMMRLLKVADQETGRVPVELPAVLIDRLKPFGPRFIKVEPPKANDKSSGKAAVEREWQKHAYAAEDAQFKEWLTIGGNYGIISGQGLIIIETDEETTNEKLAHKKTFTTKSGSGRGFHRFYRSDTTDNGVLSNKKTGENLGNVQVKNKYVVGPNCHHYTGGTYKIIDESPIEWISKQEIEETYGRALSWTGQRRKEIEEETLAEQEQIGSTIPIKDLIDTGKMHVLANHEYQGAHPIHGSETGQNFCVNTEKNLWHCFRCNSGGGTLMWIAVKNSFIKCHEAQKGVLKGEKFMLTLKAAKNEGFDLKGFHDDEELSPDVDRFFDQENGKSHFRAAYVADELMQEHTYATRKNDEITFRYEPAKGTYELYGEAHIKNQTLTKLGKYTSINRQNEVLNFIQKRTYKDLYDSPTHLIVVKNGVLNLQSGQLEPHSPEIFILNALNVQYDPKADCPNFKKFLKEVVAEGDVETIQEYIGFCLHRQYTFHKTLLLVGEGANGKSTLLETLRALLGNENVSNESLQILQNNRFAVSQLYGKLANIYADLPAIALKDTGIFKMLTGNDTISGEHKFKPIFNFKNYAKLIFSCNQIPQTPDDTAAFYRRWIIINFPNQFLDADAHTDKNLLTKLTTTQELGGIFNWALDGLKRLLQNKQFTAGKTIEETKQQYIQSSDPIRAFTEECLTETPNFVTAKDDVYNAYVQYCNSHNLPATTKNSFSMNLPKYIRTTPTQTTRLGKQQKAWKSIKLSEVIETTGITTLLNSEENSKSKNSSRESVAASVSSNENGDAEPEEWEDSASTR